MPTESGKASQDVATTEAECRHIAGLLASVEREAHVSQRKLASELGVALGLVNTYIKRCVKKGLIKIRAVPSRRYAYFLTPQGFAEKSRLTAEYLSCSLAFFRRARAECTEVMADARSRNWQRICIVGLSDLADIAILCASEQELTVVGLVDASKAKQRVMGVPVVARVDDISPLPDGWIVTAIDRAQATHDGLVKRFGPGRVLAPTMLMVRLSKLEALS